LSGFESERPITMSSSAFYAHSGRQADFSDWQSLTSHLQEVARSAMAMMQETNVSVHLINSAYVAGLLHDLGKYRPEFQQMIYGGSPPRERTYHKQAGAAKAYLLGDTSVSFAVAGHHGGLPNKVKLEDAIKSESGMPVADAVWSVALGDCSPLMQLQRVTHVASREDGELNTRMIFSCLVDSDWQDTGNHQRSTRGLAPDPPAQQFLGTQWLGHLLKILAEKEQQCREPKIRQARKDVLETCLEAADEENGIFSLSVPTGGGKTLASMAFALKHAVKHNQRRIIYVAPFVTILEQNENAIRKALGIAEDSLELFVHHSLADPIASDIQYESVESAIRRAENWDAPIVITTNVQFFESLFSNNPGRCRKVHNIANSVIILDECQSLPPAFVAPTCAMLRQLASRWNTTIILCTATQPAFDHDQLKEVERLHAKEIIPLGLNLFDRLKRVELDWTLAGSSSSPSLGLGWPELATMMLKPHSGGIPQSLCIVNSKRAARELYLQLASNAPDIAFHLSTSMCPAHRFKVLEFVRTRLQAGQACLLVSTQLIEAGVDVDFPMVLRELAPLEAIIQSAGRCNREGALRNASGLVAGKVIIFQSQASLEHPSRYYPPDAWYNAGRNTLVNSFLNANRLPRIDSPDDIHEYFTRLFHSGDLDQHSIQEARFGFRFADVAEQYRLIKEDTTSAIVANWEAKREVIERLITKLRRDPSRQNFRNLATYQVSLRTHQARQAGNQLTQVSEKIDQPIWLGPYDPNLGLSLEVNDGLMMY
jgi:CRISPR-associated endonuclease/helicase Cas3